MSQMMAPGQMQAPGGPAMQMVDPKTYTGWFEQMSKMMDPARYDEWFKGFNDMSQKLHGERVGPPAQITSPETYAQQFKRWQKMMDPAHYQKWFEAQKAPRKGTKEQ